MPFRAVFSRFDGFSCLPWVFIPLAVFLVLNRAFVGLRSFGCRVLVSCSALPYTPSGYRSAWLCYALACVVIFCILFELWRRLPSVRLRFRRSPCLRRLPLLCILRACNLHGLRRGYITGAAFRRRFRFPPSYAANLILISS